MDCQRIDAILNEQALDTLNQSEAAAVAVHLESCSRCAEAWRGQQLMAGETSATPRAGFYETVRARALGTAVATERREPARWIWPAASLAAAALLLLVLAGGVLTGDGNGEHGPQPERASRRDRNVHGHLDAAQARGLVQAEGRV
jgi:anti-sigma factor RsiW